jgi:polyhydroxyalkanoate synthesis regulator phasin
MPEKNGVLAIGGSGHEFERDPGLSEFEEEWIELVDSVRGKSETDPEESLSNSREKFKRAYTLSFEFPEKLDVYESSRDVFYEESPTEHVRTHFDNLLNDEDTGIMLKFPHEEEYLLKACELVYIDDCVFRFSKSTVFETSGTEFSPDSTHDKITFMNLPDELSREYAEWMEKMEILWNSLVRGGGLNKNETKELIDDIYEDKESFIYHAEKNDIFLPIPATEPAEALETRRNRIETLLSRRNNVDAGIVHEYCYSAVLNHLD